MAIQRDAATKQRTTTGNTNTFAHTCSTGLNRILILTVQLQDGSRTATATYGGVSMTAIDSTVYTPNGALHYIFYLINPASGTNNVVVTASANTWIGAYATSYIGAKQSGQPDGSVKGTATSTTHSVTLSVTAANSWIYSSIVGFNWGPSIDSLGTSLNYFIQGIGDNAGCADSDGTVTAGSKTVSWVNCTLTNNYGMIAISIAPAPETAQGAFLLTMV